ncbi:hypothetical protein [Micromonospora noduli]|uniref:hypothetical protein n=1 Tax=Micromonospora noduli TaxID=709876 RepID=UPI000DC3486F|nr:hypothetical protein [Micromonospora noduli]RAO13444.1 hypothetical protein LUPAC07_03736 [Micromonospora noduli]
MEGFLCFVGVTALVSFVVWQLIETRKAVATTTTETAYDPAQTAQIVRTAFGGPRAVLWTTASGPGTINMRRRGIHGGITMSVTIAPRPGGGSRVAMWASETVIFFGFLVNFAGSVNGRKKAIGRLLEAAQ